MSISLDYPLPKNRNLADFTEAKFAHRSRKWWGFWNWGHPVPEIIEQEVTKKKLKLVFNAQKSLRNNLSSGEASLIFSRFCWEFDRFKENTVLPHTRIRFCWDNSSTFNQFGKTLPRLMMLPQILENPSDPKSLPDINDTSAVLKKAWSCLKRATSSFKGTKNLRANVSLDEAITHISEFELVTIPLKISSKYKNFAFLESEDLELVFDKNRNETRLRPVILAKSGKFWFLNLDSNGIRLGEELNKSFKPTNHVPIPLKVECEGEVTERNTWMEMLGFWMGENYPLSDLTTEVCRLSELLDDYNLVYPVTRVDNHPKAPKKGHYVYRLDRTASHPLWGSMDRPDSHQLVEKLYSKSDLENPEVTIGDPVPHPRNKDNFRLIGVHDDDSELVLLKAENRPPSEGWLKPIDAGTLQLVRRKESFQEQAMQSRFLSRLFYSANRCMPEFWTKKNVRDSQKKLGRITTCAPLHLVIGPPGTGKTWTANRLVQDILKDEPHARILVCAKEHFALNHLAMNIRTSFREGRKCHKVVRILPIHKEERAFAGDYKDLDKAKPEKVGKKTWKSRIAAGSRHKKFKDLWTDIESEISGLTAPWVSKSAFEEASVICTTTMDHSLNDMLSENEPPTFDYVLIEEAGKAYPSELIAPMALSRQWVLIGDDRQLPPFRLQESRRNVNKILKLDYKTLSENRKDPHVQNLFDKFRRGLLSETNSEDVERWLQPFKNFKRYVEDCHIDSHFLNQQYRMEKDLSDIISQVFYGTTFEHKKPECVWKQPRNRLLSGEFPLIWIDMPSAIENGKWAESLRYRNLEEAKIVKSIMNELTPNNLDVKILTPYNFQKSYLQKILGGFRNHVNTVDEFQGREADVVVLSLVRNNKRTKVGKRWGFLSEPTRLNVMFSRAKQVLVVIGSLTHISDTEFYPDENELQKIAEAFRSKSIILSPKDIRREMKK